MTMKKLAYSVQKQLQASTGVSFKRAHIYELLAASFGYSSYAGLGGEAVFTERSFSSRRPKTNALLVHERCLGLAYGSSVAKLVSDSLPAFLTDSEIGIIKLADLVAYLQVGASSPGDDEGEMSAGEGDDWNVEDDRGVDSLALTSPILLEGLESAAQRGYALAHYALALIYGADEDGQERETGSAYWYERAKSGWILSGVEKEWADAHALTLSQAEKHEQHLREAARLGHPEAWLDLADQYGDPSFFARDFDASRVDLARAAAIAERLDRHEDAYQWLTKAAKSGDVQAMLRLIEDYDHDNSLQCWTWVYLSQLVGTDLLADDYRAIHEDGSDYDDDVGGPLFVDGRGGVQLEPIAAQDDAMARRKALEFFTKIESS